MSYQKQPNPYGLTQEECERLEARADFFDALANIQKSRCADDYRPESGGFDTPKDKGVISNEHQKEN